jgi:16S rRNA (uracil1498-N3)-methyltransferase
VRPEHRLYVASPLAAGRTLTLDPDRSHYLCRVLRQRRGDALTLFNGDGRAFRGVIATADARSCEVELRDIAATEPPPRVRVHVAQALIKTERQDWMLQKATELGATDVWLLVSEYTEVRASGPRLERRLAHWQRVVVSAAEQSGRYRLPQLHGPLPLSDFLRTQPAPQLLLMDPGAAPLGRVAFGDTALLLGPEGGFSAAERDAALSAGATAVGLGDLILRSDTAPVVALGVLRQAWGWQPL